MSDDDVKRNIRPKKKTPPKRNVYIVDGKARPKAVEHSLNEAFAITFRDACGQRVIDYLKSISTNMVLPPGTDPDTINYFEGARWLMGIIDKRKKDGEEKKP